MDDETRDCLIQLAQAVEHLAAAVDGISGAHQSTGAREAGIGAQGVINRLHGAPVEAQMSTGDGLGGANTGGAE